VLRQPSKNEQLAMVEYSEELLLVFDKQCMFLFAIGTRVAIVTLHRKQNEVIGR